MGEVAKNCNLGKGQGNDAIRTARGEVRWHGPHIEHSLNDWVPN